MSVAWFLVVLFTVLISLSKVADERRARGKTIRTDHPEIGRRRGGN